MRVKMVRMREAGVELPRRMLQDRYTVKHWGALTIADEMEPALRRVVKVARLALDTGDRVLELLEPQIHWANGQSFALGGFERREVNGESVAYAQGWLCTVELDEAGGGHDATERDAKRAVRH
jgi:hypothetical protein